MGFPGHANANELQQIEEINSLLVGGEHRTQPSMPQIPSTLYLLRTDESRPQPFHRGSVQPPKLSLADHPHMRVLSPNQMNPTRKASAPQFGFHVPAVTSQSMPRQLPFLYSAMYPSPATQHTPFTHQRPEAVPTFDLSSSFSSFAGTSSSRPTTSGSDLSTSSTESMFGFPSDSTSSSVSPADDLNFGVCQDDSLVKMENSVTGVDLVGWGGPGFFGLDTMGGFDAFGNVPQC